MTDLYKPHIYIDGVAINKSAAKHSEEMLEALRLFESGWSHFLKCANLKESFLDAEAITWMNEVSIKAGEAIQKATK